MGGICQHEFLEKCPFLKRKITFIFRVHQARCAFISLVNKKTTQVRTVAHGSFQAWKFLSESVITFPLKRLLIRAGLVVLTLRKLELFGGKYFQKIIICLSHSQTQQTGVQFSVF